MSVLVLSTINYCDIFFYSQTVSQYPNITVLHILPNSSRILWRQRELHLRFPPSLTGVDNETESGLSQFLHLAARVMKGSRKGKKGSWTGHVCISSMRTAALGGPNWPSGEHLVQSVFTSSKKDTAIRACLNPITL